VIPAQDFSDSFVIDNQRAFGAVRNQVAAPAIRFQADRAELKETIEEAFLGTFEQFRVAVNGLERDPDEPFCTHGFGQECGEFPFKGLSLQPIFEFFAWVCLS